MKTHSDQLLTWCSGQGRVV